MSLNQRHEFQTNKVEDLLQILGTGVLVRATTSGSTNTEGAVTHNLGRIPRGYIVFAQDKAAVIYAGGTANTTSLIYLRSEVASVTFTAYVF